jgi:hypothetical protein
VVEVNGEASRGEVGAEGEERGGSSVRHSSYSHTRQWSRVTEMVGGNGGEAMGRQGNRCSLNVVGTAALWFGPCG